MRPMQYTYRCCASIATVDQCGSVNTNCFSNADVSA